MMYNHKTFRSVHNSGTGEVSGDTVFHHRQNGPVVWAEYAGGAVVKGFLIATVQAGNELDIRYQHVNQAGELRTGRCRSTPEVLPETDGCGCTNAGSGPRAMAQRADPSSTKWPESGHRAVGLRGRMGTRAGGVRAFSGWSANNGEALPAVITPVITQRQYDRYKPDGNGSASALQVKIRTAVGANALFCKANKAHKC